MLQRLGPMAVLLVLLVLLTGTAPVSAQGPAAPARNEAFTVGDVRVDVTAGTISEARDRAFIQGQRVALGQLIERLAGRNRIDVDALSAAQLGQMVQSFQVNEERSAPGRYIATLTYVFRPNEVRTFLRSRDVAFAEPQPAGSPSGTPALPFPPSVPPPSGAAVPAPGPAMMPVLVIPVLRSPQGPLLWDSPNGWRTAWLNYSGEGQLAPIMVPFGDLQDVVDVNAERALAGERSALSAIARRYGAGDVVVAVADPRGDGLAVELNRYGQAGGADSQTLSVPAAGTPERLFDEAVSRSAAQIASQPAMATAAPAAPSPPAASLEGSRQLLVLVPLGAPAEWFQTQALLRNVPNVVAANIISLSSREVVLRLNIAGNEEQLRAALAQQGLALQQGPAALELHRLGFR